ncbi:D-alanyl-D-alanine carboxypeptidase/D-alanyl-D-alanine endopeptidase [Saccharopolyspora antimicrobica]|uniref:D-alanyl-D-alanine carboxypeptidase/D-alanyl-D-alanine endopeptidase n=1 Tax=Saccharopolyspora antimicrobica TaxID=455193 RepID=UPI0011609166|nr:D-alanyl-D-alanine carboxypeptidase/D-alanyl-D-alanine-endopeptidase [Saccharopolyspora antimicrobica]
MSGALVEPEAETARLQTVEDERETTRLKTVEDERETARLQTAESQDASASKRVAGNLSDEPEATEDAAAEPADAEAPADPTDDDAVEAADSAGQGASEEPGNDSAEQETPDDSEPAGQDAAADSTEEPSPAESADQDDEAAAEPSEDEPSDSAADQNDSTAGGEGGTVNGRVTGTVDVDGEEPERAAEPTQADADSADGSESGDEPASDAAPEEEQPAESSDEPEAADENSAASDVSAGEQDDADAGATEGASSEGDADQSAADEDTAEADSTSNESAGDAEAAEQSEPEADDDQPDDAEESVAEAAASGDSAGEQADDESAADEQAAEEADEQDSSEDAGEQSDDAAETVSVSVVSADEKPAGQEEQAPSDDADEESVSWPSAEEPPAEDAADEAAPDDDAEDGPTGPVVPPPTAVEQTQQFKPITDAPPPAVERTQAIGRVDSTQQVPRVPAAPEERAAESTQLIAKVPAETEVERTTRLELSDLAELRKSADPGPATQRIPVVPPVEPAERTQQFARPDFNAPRPASPADFAGLTAPSASPGDSAGLDAPTASPGDFPGLSAPTASPDDFAGITAPHVKPQAPTPPPVASPEDFAGLRAQPARIDPPNAASAAGLRAQPQHVGQAQPAAPAKRSRKGLIAVAAAVVVLLAAGIGFGPQLLLQAQIEDPPPPVRLDPSIKPLAQDTPQPTPSGVAAVLAGPLSNPALGTLAGIVRDARTGQVLWSQTPDQALVPASTGKLLAMSAALLVLDHDQRLTTKVVRGSQPGSVVLVGGGDVTLSTLPPGQESVYPGAARFDDLIQQVREATGGNVTSVQVDTGRYKEPDLAKGWLPGDVRAGMMAPMEPVMLNGGRDDPTQEYSPRSEQPARQAAQRLADAFGATVAGEVTAPGNGEVLGQVQSPTVQEMVDIAMLHSDNMLAEVLAHEVAIATGHYPSFEGSWKAVRKVLADHGFDVSGTEMADGSGLSVDDRATPKLLAELLTTATTEASPEGGLPPQAAKLRGLLTGLPVAGGSGSLEGRYGSSDGRGWVRAKTGTLTGVNSLAGTVVTKDGRLLVFALMSNGPGTPDEGRKALDAVTGALHSCGCR